MRKNESLTWSQWIWAPRPLTFDLWTLWRLMTTTTTTAMEDYMLVLVLQKILSLSELPEKGWWTTDSPFCSSSCCVRFLLLLSTVFGEFKAPPIGLEYELQRVESFTMDPFGRKYSWNDAEEDGGEKIVLLRVDVAWSYLLLCLPQSRFHSHLCKLHFMLRLVDSPSVWPASTLPFSPITAPLACLSLAYWTKA